ncbi:MAG: Gfo/Idh/MocA family oxidoreductase [Myxococcota bacterium]|jgi:predicted dehydrogenase|nr:Gfo/Idh/MocA family oxidoreductase [Myxococcota bacterium]
MALREQLGFGVVGTGGIARDFTRALERSPRCRVVSVTGSSFEKARAFQAEFALAGSAESLSALLSDQRVDAVYIASPHPFHEAQAIECLRAKKAVLCEKPLTLDAAACERVLDVARGEGVFLMEGFMYRCHPLLRELVERVRAGAIGELLHVRADFGFRAARNPEGRLFAPRLGGGAIFDVGGYPASFARLVAGLAEGAPFAEPVRLSAWGKLGPTGVDELAGARLAFTSGFTAELGCAVSYELGTRAVLFGEKGRIELPNPWIPSGDRHALRSELTVFRDGAAPETVRVDTERAVYALEAELVAETLPAIEAPWPAMGWADSLGNARVLDAWRSALVRG